MSDESNPTAENSQDQTTPEQTTAEQPKDNLPENTVAVEDIGTLKRKVVVTVPRARIDAKLNEMFGDLSKNAVVPGFRQGHAPRRLIEKRFGKEISSDVRNSLIGEAIGQAAEKQNLRTVSEPKFDLEKIELPATGDLTFDFEVEVAPEFDLPEVKGIKVNKPVIKIDEKRVDEALQNMRRGQTHYEPTEEAAAEGDAIMAGVKIAGEGIEPVEKHGLTFRVVPGQVEGIPLLDMGTKLAGKKANEAVAFTAKIADTHPTEAWRGKDLTIELSIGQVRKAIMPTIDEEYAKNIGFESLAQLREEVGKRLEERVQGEIKQAMRSQVCKYLLEHTKFDLPEGVVTRHASRIVMRRAVDLMQQGVPKEMVEENIAKMQAAAAEQAREDLRVGYILGKFAEEENLQVTDGEVNARIAAIAFEYNKRPERMRQEMEADGSLEAMIDRLHEEKAVDKLLEVAEIVEVADAGESAAPQEPKKE